MKVVVNRCYGGFSLSAEAVKKYIELTGKKCWFILEQYGSNYGDAKTITLVKPDCGMVPGKNTFFYSFDARPPKKMIDGWDNRGLTKRDPEIAAFWENHHVCDGHLKRNDPLLIQVVEELGERANGSCANLEVVEIPDGIDWVIDEYDGMERVEEAHRSW